MLPALPCLLPGNLQALYKQELITVTNFTAPMT